MLEGEVKRWVVPFAAAMMSLGTDIEQPRIVKRFNKHIAVRYLTVFVGLWQGPANQDVFVAGTLTLILYLIVEFLNSLE